jgi:release factor glutamine methyltransferase
MAEAEHRLAVAGVASPAAEARWIVEEASGLEGAELVEGLARPATRRGVARFDAVLGRRLGGEPLQYALGRWPFRRLDLLLDGRVLIPRPETEVVVDHALAELDRLGSDGVGRIAVDLGTGSGAIALSLAVERPGLEVWAGDVSEAALDVARANLAGTGRAGTRVRLVAGSWFDALPGDLAGRIDLVVANPPYVGADEALPDEVAAWEPPGALVAGPTGREALEAVIGASPRWLAPGGALVLELAPHQAGPVARHAARAGLAAVRVERDLSGRPRVLVAHRP